VGKQDSTGSYSYLCDGASPASPVLWDGQAVYTAGLSERRGGVSSFSDFDRLGNLWTVDGSAGAVQLYYQDTTGFGGLLAAAGNVGTPFRFGGGNGCQTDADSGLVLMGHRYYDTRIGRFISQDPVRSGGNWYAYASNSPVNSVDPSGLVSYDTNIGPYKTASQTFGDMTAALDATWTQFDASLWDKAQKKAEATADNIQLVINFVCGWGPDHEVYDMSTERTQQFMQSRDAEQIAILIGLAMWPNQASGNIGTLQAFTNSIADRTNDIEWQLGAIDWSSKRIGGYEYIQVGNVVSWNSLMYHIPQYIGTATNNPTGPKYSFFSDITQNIFYRIPVPAYAK